MFGHANALRLEQVLPIVVVYIVGCVARTGQHIARICTVIPRQKSRSAPVNP